MTEFEWMSIGYDKGIIDVETLEEISFRDAFRQWFLMKKNCIKPQTLDRIEVTWNRYFDDCPLVEKYISKVTDLDLAEFVMDIVVKKGNISYKELARIMQIVKEPLVFMRDLNKGNCPLHDWEKIKRCIPVDKLSKEKKNEMAIPMASVQRVIDKVVNHKVYYIKQDACLCLCMNFYLGLRIGELASLTWQDFDFDRNVVKVYKTESKFYERDADGSKLGVMVYRVQDSTKTIYSVREVPLLPEVKVIYQKIRDHHELMGYDSQYLAYDGTDCILVRSLDRTLRRLCNLCEVQYFNSHEIRKTFCSILHYANVPTRVIADLVGHSEIGTTENSYILSYGNNYQKVYDMMKGALVYA